MSRRLEQPKAGLVYLNAPYFGMQGEATEKAPSTLPSSRQIRGGWSPAFTVSRPERVVLTRDAALTDRTSNIPRGLLVKGDSSSQNQWALAF